MTPDYLGFAKLDQEKGSPFGRVLKGALSTYGEVQDLAQKTYATKAMPKKIEQEQKMGEQKITRGEQEIKAGELKLSRLPKELEQEESARTLDIQSKQTVLKYLPRGLQGKLTAQDLENIHQGLQNKIAGMSIEQMNDQIAQGELAKVYQARLDGEHPEAAQKQWELSRKKLAAHGVNAAALPEKLDDNVIAMGKAAHQQQQMASPLVQKLIELQAEYKGKGQLEEIKKAGAAQDAYDKKAAQVNAEYFEQKLPEQQKAARAVLSSVRNIRELVQKNEWAFGPQGVASGGLWFSPEAGEAIMEMNNIVANKLSGITGASRGGKMYLDFAKSLKTSKFDRPKTTYRLLNNLEAAGEILDEEANFGEYVASFGVRSQLQTVNSWDKFLASQNDFKDKKGNVMPGRANQWMKYFDEHPEDLPRGIHTKLADEGRPIAPAQAAGQVQQGLPTPPAPAPAGPALPNVQAQAPATTGAIAQIFGESGLTSPLLDVIPDFGKLLGG
jgi:hypothetical protein